MGNEQGVVKWFSVEKGYGFIRREMGSDVFVHHKSIIPKGFILQAGDLVNFDVTEGPKGLQARDVVKIG
jgi:cold shock protein